MPRLAPRRPLQGLWSGPLGRLEEGVSAVVRKLQRQTVSRLQNDATQLGVP